ncbi:hypothetical protein Tco_1559908, partial [Tanacetum coccineum]
QQQKYYVKLNLTIGIRASFMKAMDDSNELVYRQFANLFLKVGYLNISQEATLKEDLRIIDKFVYELIRKKRGQMKDGNL